MKRNNNNNNNNNDSNNNNNKDGRLIPGDRIVYVNSDKLNNSSLDTAVQVGEQSL